VNLPSPRLSYSQVLRLSGCSWQWFLERIHGFRSVPSWAMVAGTAIHQATEGADRKAIGDPDPGPCEFGDAFDLSITAEEERSGIPRVGWTVTGRKTREAPNGRDYDWWISEGTRQVRSWTSWASRQPLDLWVDPEGRPGIEVRLETVRGAVGTLGSADRVYEVRGTSDHLVVDLKSGQAPKSPAQLGDYADALSRVHGLPCRWGAFWLGSTGCLTEIADVSPWVGNRIAALYENAARIVTEGSFLPSADFRCGYCSVRKHCFVHNPPGDGVPGPEDSYEEEKENG
jgi:hypothetical protein